MKNLPLREKLFIIALLLICVLLVSNAVLVVYWIYIQDNPPATINNEPLPVTSGMTEYRPGDTITFHLDFCRNTTGAIRFTRRWVDGLMYIEPEQKISGGNEECFDRDLVATVPQIPPGVYHVEYNVIYTVNPLAERTVTFITESFTIAEP